MGTVSSYCNWMFPTKPHELPVLFSFLGIYIAYIFIRLKTVFSTNISSWLTDTLLLYLLFESQCWFYAILLNIPSLQYLLFYVFTEKYGIQKWKTHLQGIYDLKKFLNSYFFKLNVLVKILTFIIRTIRHLVKIHLEK